MVPVLFGTVQWFSCRFFWMRVLHFSFSDTTESVLISWRWAAAITQEQVRRPEEALLRVRLFAREKLQANAPQGPVGYADHQKTFLRQKWAWCQDPLCSVSNFVVFGHQGRKPKIVSPGIPQNVGDIWSIPCGILLLLTRSILFPPRGQYVLKFSVHAWWKVQKFPQNLTIVAPRPLWGNHRHL